MYKPAVDWNPRQARLREALKAEADFAEAKTLCLQLHGLVHLGAVSKAATPTLADEVRGGLEKEHYRIMPTPKDETIAWCIWHTARIEDITMNLLVADQPQVLNAQWRARLNTQITDTGNAMSDEEILRFSAELDIEALWDYRSAVGEKSREIVNHLEFAELSRRFSIAQLARLTVEGCLLEHPDSIWLRDFWGRKNVAGILLMPLTRHQAGHLNDCLKLKSKFLKGSAKNR